MAFSVIVILQTSLGFVSSSSAGAEVWLLPLMVGAALLATAAVSLGFQAGFFVFFFFFSNRAPMIEEEEPAAERRALSATMMVTQKVLNGKYEDEIFYEVDKNIFSGMESFIKKFDN